MKTILIMGLPGSGKTYLANELKSNLESAGYSVTWYNADQVREQYNDWDFSRVGRIRQSIRMKEMALESKTDYVICDFVAPLEEMRFEFDADWVIWMDTISSGRFDDTNKMFEQPKQYDFHISEKNAEFWAEYITERIVTNTRRPIFNWQKETVQMLGRWQPWHEGHRALFERALTKTGQVCIMVRDCQNWNDSNPFAVSEVVNYIKRDLDPLYQGRYEVLVVPNIVNITYGRDVGYKIEQEVFDEHIHAISATNIRKSMGLE